MPTYVTREEFEARMWVLEGEVEGEKAVTRHILEQTHRNGDELIAARSELAVMRSELGTVKTRVDHLAGDVALVKAAVTSHTGLLNVLTQDVGQLRQETGQLRHDMGTMREEMGTMREEMGTMRADIAAIRTAVAPREPPPGA
jgi:chromosome segregation ATPase